VPAKSLLIVLLVRDAGVRSTMAARLSMHGVDVLTASEFHDPVMHRTRGRAVLVTDEAIAAEDRAEWAEALQDEARWLRIVVLTAEPPEPSGPDDRLVFVQQQHAAAQLVALLPEWTDSGL